MKRERQSLPIRGIDRAGSDDTVADGACEDIYNLRYRSGVFETVCEPRLLHPVAHPDGYSVVIRLEGMEPGEYVARKGNSLSRVSLLGGRIEELESIGDLPPEAESVRYFRYGSLLYATWYCSDELQEAVWRYDSGTFSPVDLPSLPPPALSITCERKAHPELKTYSYQDGSLYGLLLSEVEFEASQDSNGKETDEDTDVAVESRFYYNIGNEELHNDGYLVGTVYLFAAWRLYDGSIVKPGPLFAVSSDNDFNDASLYKIRVDDHKHRYRYIRPIRTNTLGGGVKPTLTIDPPDASLTGLIKDVAIFSTRDMPTYLYEKAHEDFDSYEPLLHPDGSPNTWISALSVIWNKDELEENLGPFYRIATIDLHSGERSLTLEYKDHYLSVVNETLYEADFSRLNPISRGKYEYNDRLHLYDIRYRFPVESIPAFLSPGSPQLPSGVSFVEDPELTVGADYELIVDGRTEHVQVLAPYRGYWQSALSDPELPSDPAADDSRKPSHPSDTALYWYFPKLQSYPDYRAERVDFWIRYRSTVIAHWSLRLTSSAAQNMSWGLMREAAGAKFGLSLFDYLYATLPSADLSSYPATGYHPVDPGGTIVQSNRIWVSAASNPFEFNPSQIYRVGSPGERILDLIATVERMTEAAYGYQPLLVFTDRAVYALESGEGSVLYARTIPILSRTLLEGTNAVEGDGTIFFISTSGITAIVRGQIATISDAMKRWSGLRPADTGLADFDEYTQAARLLFNRKASELIVYNPAYPDAYIYSLSGSYWTRRAWEGFVEPYFDELATTSGVASLSEEDVERPVSECRLITRPLKFGSLEYKRIETLVARMRYGGSTSFELSVEGSDDAIRWFPLRSEQNRAMIRRTPSSFRYHRVRLAGSVDDYLAITHFDVEFYHKFVHRLR